MAYRFKDTGEGDTVRSSERLYNGISDDVGVDLDDMDVQVSFFFFFNILFLRPSFCSSLCLCVHPCLSFCVHLNDRDSQVSFFLLKFL